MKSCAVAVYDEKGRLFSSPRPDRRRGEGDVRAELLPKDVDPSGKPRTMMYVAFCPGGGKSEANPAAVKSVELSVSSARPDAPAAVGLRPSKDAKEAKELTIETLAGTLAPGGRLSGRITERSERRPQVLLDVLRSRDPRETSRGGSRLRD